VRDQASHPYRTTRKIIVTVDERPKGCELNGNKHYPSCSKLI
jgi:hypothetical protein